MEVVMLTILIGPGTECMATTDGRRMTVYSLLAEEYGECMGLHERTDFSEVTEVQMCLLRWPLTGHKAWIKLTPVLQTGVLKFLREYHARGDIRFDCYSFARYVYGVDLGHRQRVWPDFWNTRPILQLRCRQVGDVVFLVRSESQTFCHAAIYIGRGLYISVYGGGGDLEVATLRSMLHDFHANTVLSVVPRVSS